MIAKFCFALLLIIMPLMLAGNRWWIINPFEFTVALIFIIKLKNIILSLHENSDFKNCSYVFLGFGLLIVITGFLTINPHSTLNAISYFITLYLCFLISGSDLFSKKDRRFFSLIMILSGTIQPLIAIFQLNGYLSNKHWIPGNFIAGTFSNHNHFAGFIALTLLLTLTWLYSLNMNQHTGRIFLTVSAVIQFFGIIFSQSRGAWIAFSFSVIYLFYVGLTKKAFVKMIIFSSILILLFLSFIPKGDEAASRLKTLLKINNDNSAQSRIDIWKASFSIIKENKYKGTGIGTFRDSIVFFKPKGINQFINHAHNDYIQWMSECGIFSIFIIIYIIIFLIFRGVSFSLKDSFFPITCGASVLLTAVHSLFDYNIRIPAIGFYIAVIIGFSFAGKKIQKTKI